MKLSEPDSFCQQNRQVLLVRPNDTAGRDLKALTDLEILSAQGKGRAAHYVMRVPAEPTRISLCSM